jgi:hypothetical protein
VKSAVEATRAPQHTKQTCGQQLTTMRNPPGLLPKLNLTEEERRVYNLLFKQADTKNDGIVTGDVAIPLFARTKIPEHTLGEVSGAVPETKRHRS